MVLLVLNGFLIESQKKLAGCGLQLNSDPFDIVSLFINKLLDKCCDFNEASNTTEIFTEYVELGNFRFQRQMTPEWTMKEIYLLERRFVSFNVRVTKTLGPYLVSNIQTKRWHALDDVWDGIKEAGTMTYYMSRFLKKLTNCSIKAILYRKKSKKCNVLGYLKESLQSHV